MNITNEYKLGKRQIALEELRARSQTEGARVENEENRRATERYLAMFRQTQEREDIETSRDRQMQLVMGLLGGLTGFRQQAGRTLVDAQRTMPPMALTTLMRGM